MFTRREFMQWFAASLCVPPLVMAEAQAGEPGPPPTATGSDVGSLYPFIQSQAVKGEFPLSFLNRHFRSLPAWKRRARGKLLDLLEYAPPQYPHRAEVVERTDCGDYFREKLYFNTTPDVRVPAYVLVPKNAKLPAPGIVALHDHGAFYFWGKEKLVELEDEHAAMTKFKQQYYDGHSTASVLARQGYVVIVIDMFYWGERRMLLDKDPADWRDRPKDIAAERIAAFNQRASQSEQLVGRTIYAAGFTWPGVMFWDDIRTVDYLATRPEVDKKRIGCVGLSVGGLRSCHLAALDDRIKAAVVVGWMTSIPAQLKRHVVNTIGHTKVVPGLYRHLDYPDVATLAMPSALLVINGRKDTLFAPEGVRAAFDKLTACYQKAGAPEKLRLRMYDTPHEFNAEMQAEAWAWLKQWV
jgi:dienelactone hydrolase